MFLGDLFIVHLKLFGKFCFKNISYSVFTFPTALKKCNTHLSDMKFHHPPPPKFGMFV
jgi:hypothetical protein